MGKYVVALSMGVIVVAAPPLAAQRPAQGDARPVVCKSLAGPAGGQNDRSNWVERNFACR